MGLFDKLKSNAKSGLASSISNLGNKTEVITINALPESLSEMQALPEASLDSPFKTAALTVCALCAFAADEHIGTDMLNFLRGPRPLTGYDISFMKDRFRGNRTYIPFSYFEGAVPGNDYTPSEPFKITIQSTSHSNDTEGYVKLFIQCGGADSPRPITMRQKGDQWFLWEQALLTDIRQPKSSDPWA